MKPLPSSEHEEQDRELLRILKDLGSLPAAYPPELLTARRSAFLTQVERFQAVEAGEGLSAGDEPIVKLLGSLKSAQAEYPADLLAARRSALLKQMDRAEAPTLLDAFRSFIHRTFQTPGTLPRLRQLSFVIGSLLAALFIGSLLFNHGESSLTPAPTPGVAAPGASEVAISICEAEDRIPPCAPEALAPEQDLANSGNGSARPAISSANAGAAHTAAYVNDGRGGASWVSHGADSWIKIDLGKVTTINTVSLQSGDLDSSGENDPGQFVIAVALSDVYADGDSRNDSTEYAQVFHSEQTGFGGTLSEAETIQTQFPSVRARYVKITFEKAGAAIEEVGIFMVEPPVVAKQPTRPPHEDPPGVPLNPARTDTPSPIDTAGPLPTGTGLATDTVVSTPTETPNPSETPPPESSATPTALPTETVTPVPTEPPPTDTPIPSATAAPPTVPPPTALPPEVEPTAANTEPIVVTGNRQTLTFTCNGNAAEIRGHANTITLLGSCSSITVTGNGNSVFWESGSPVLQDKGKDNLIRQL